MFDLHAQLTAHLGARVLVLGLGASGKAAFELCAHAGLELVGYDQKAPSLDTRAQIYVAPKIPDEAFAGVTSVLISPGMDPRPVAAQMQRLCPKARLVGEMGVALWLAQRLWAKVPTVLITGTNGKSTVTDLCAHLLGQAMQEVFAGGNLGVPLSRKVLQVLVGQSAAPKALVLECSSYQLETMHEVSAQVVMLLNLSPDHLDRYRDFDHYAQTKAKIFSFATDRAISLFDATDAHCAALAPQGAVAVAGATMPCLQGPLLKVDAALELERSTLSLAGQHNAKNALFALAAARHLGVSPQLCAKGLASYKGLAHRMQLVQEKGAVRYYNDSKATNVASVQAGLDGFDRPFVLICGGQAKQGDSPSALARSIAARARALVGLGQDGDAFVQAAKDEGIEAHRVQTLQEAVALAASLARPGDAVLLSPACASWDQFSSYAARGQAFVDAVQAL